MSLQEGSSVKIGLREANQRFSKIVAVVKSGEEVVLTERGTPIALIKPIGAPESDADRIHRLRALGALIPATDSRPMTAWTPVRSKGRSSVELLREERDAE
jgi:prevent-host-death family protein